MFFPIVIFQCLINTKSYFDLQAGHSRNIAFLHFYRHTINNLQYLPSLYFSNFVQVKSGRKCFPIWDNPTHMLLQKLNAHSSSESRWDESLYKRLACKSWKKERTRDMLWNMGNWWTLIWPLIWTLIWTWISYRELHRHSTEKKTKVAKMTKVPNQQAIVPMESKYNPRIIQTSQTSLLDIVVLNNY